MNKIIAIGGTGIKCLESFVHFCALTLEKQEYEVLIIEADHKNGNLERLQETIKSYTRLQDILYNGAKDKNHYAYGFGGQFANLTGQNKFVVWHPNDITYIKNSTRKVKNTLRNLKGYERSKLIEALYTYDELESNLEIGFRGHPSIGALLSEMSMDISKDDDIWKDFIGKNSKTCSDNEHKEPTYVFILGSVFGGTGAAGIYSVLNKIVDYKCDDVSYSNLIGQGNIKIALGMMTPYYELPENKAQDDKDDNNDLAAVNIGENTKYALMFYKTHNELMKKTTIVSVGKFDRDDMYEREMDKTSKVWYTNKIEFNKGGERQKNPALISEFVMASSMWQYFFKPLNFDVGKMYVPERKTNSDNINIISKESFPVPMTEFGKKLSRAITVSLCYTNKMHPKIEKYFRNNDYDGDFMDNYRWLIYLEKDKRNPKILNDMWGHGNDSNNVNQVKMYYESFYKWLKSIGFITMPATKVQQFMAPSESLSNFVKYRNIEAIVSNTEYKDIKVNYGDIIVGYNSKKKWGKIAAKLSDGAASANLDPGQGLKTLLIKLYQVESTTRKWERDTKKIDKPDKLVR